MKVLVLVNTLQDVNSAVYANHCQFWAHTKAKYPDDKFLFFTPHRMSIDMARNLAAKTALEQECDYLMFIDDDVLIEPHTFTSLKEANKDVIMALTYIRAYPFKPMLFKNHPSNDKALAIYDDFEENIDENGLVRCAAIGFSCALIKCAILKKLVTPYFVTGTTNTEDIYFCMEAQKQLDEVSIFTDTKVPTGHLLSPEAIMPSNRDALRIYYETIGAKIQEDIKQDRQQSYVESCLNAIR